MPHFYIDSDDGKLSVIDEDGAEYRDLASAEDEAMRALPEMSQSRHPARDWRQISATVRDADGVGDVAVSTPTGSEGSPTPLGR